MKKMENPAGIKKIHRREESGVTLVITLMILLVLTLIGAAALMTSSVDLRITGNERVQKQAFYAADAGLHYGRANPPVPLTNINAANPGSFSNPSGSATKFRGSIVYPTTLTTGAKNPTNPPVAAETGTRQGFKAHHYTVSSTGYGENQAQKELQLQGYRIGF